MGIAIVLLMMLAVLGATVGALGGGIGLLTLCAVFLILGCVIGWES
jgi:hypothetical protein